jgi:hypothetical protein
MEGGGMIGQTSPHPEWRIALGLLRDRDYDSTVSHDELAQATGLRYPSPKYFNHINRAGKALRREFDRVLISVASLGYRIIKPNECHDEGRRQAHIANRRHKRARETVAAAPDVHLTEPERLKKTDTLAKFGALEAMGRRVMKETRPAALPTARADTPKLFQAS